MEVRFQWSDTENTNPLLLAKGITEAIIKGCPAKVAYLVMRELTAQMFDKLWIVVNGLKKDEEESKPPVLPPAAGVVEKSSAD